LRKDREHTWRIGKTSVTRIELLGPGVQAQELFETWDPGALKNTIIGRSLISTNPRPYRVTSPLSHTPADSRALTKWNFATYVAL
jgi:hypothetical protein